MARSKRPYKPQKIPGFKRRLCFVFEDPHFQHKTEESAEAEMKRLSKRYKGSKFEVFYCEHCRKWHVGKPSEEDGRREGDNREFF